MERCIAIDRVSTSLDVSRQASILSASEFSLTVIPNVLSLNTAPKNFPRDSSSVYVAPMDMAAIFVGLKTQSFRIWVEMGLSKLDDGSH